jgi:hypothetical protein
MIPTRVFGPDVTLVDAENASLADRRVISDGAGGYYIGSTIADDPGNADAVWCIRNVDAAGNTIFADGDRSMSKVWNSRATYTYTQNP